MRLLADTNIFLEILLEQNKSAVCQSFLEEHHGEIFISDFSLHSIGVILFRSKRQALFSQFCADILPTIHILSLSETEDVINIADVSQTNQLDFDDSYQVKVCELYNLELVTMDFDFKKLSSPLKVTYP